MLKKRINTILKNRSIFKTSLTLFCLLLFPSVVFAAPEIVDGTVALFKAISGWLLLIIPVGAGAMLAFFAFQKSVSDDQAVIAEQNKKMKNVLIGAIIAMTASGIVTAVLSFYN